ncbi:MAG: ArsR family transcriptional regulator, partial [Acidobacteriota bacterium]|nr:ArsR family transcriptional regulator [Acidobacteriota bacterium]
TQALYAAAKLGVADLLRDGPRTAAEIACELQVNETALYRVLRALASEGCSRRQDTGRSRTPHSHGSLSRACQIRSAPFSF